MILQEIITEVLLNNEHYCAGGIHTLTIGLGGGALPAFIDKFLPQV